MATKVSSGTSRGEKGEGILVSLASIVLLIILLAHQLTAAANEQREDAASHVEPVRLFKRLASVPVQERVNVSFQESNQLSNQVAITRTGSGPEKQLASLLRRQKSHKQVGLRNGTIGSEASGIVHIQVTAIHVDKSEFPLSKLLFKLTLRLALGEASRLLEQQAGSVPQQQRQQQQLDERNQQQKLAKVRLRLNVRSANTCSRQYAAALAAEQFHVKRSRLFIVSGCDDAIRAVSLLASQWQVPVMTAAGFGADLNDKQVHKTLVRVAFSLRAAVEFLFKILRSFQWRKVNLVLDESDANSLALRGSIEQHTLKMATSTSGRTQQDPDQFQVSLNTISFDLQSLLRNNEALATPDDDSFESTPASNGTVDATSRNDDDNWPNQLTEKVVRDTLWQCSTYSRVTVLLIPQDHVRKFMLSAYDQQMANGHYTFINMPLLAAAADSQELSGQSSSGAEPAGGASKQQSYATSENAFVWRSTRSRRNAHAKQAFESLMSIYLRTPTTKAYVYFASKLINLANDNSLQPASSRRVQLNINPYAASFYDALQIYASALNESLSESKWQQQFQLANSTHATSLIRQKSFIAQLESGGLHARISGLMRNRRFDNMVTGNVYINQNGDRETDYTLDDMNQMTGKFAPVILYRGETRDIERLGRIHWSSDASVGPTSDLVDCTLTGTCVSKPMTRFTFVLILLSGPLAIILTGLFYCVHNKLSLESQLVDYWWKIHLSDLEIVTTRRKKANDGSLVMQAQLGPAESIVAGDARSNSLASSSSSPYHLSRLCAAQTNKNQRAGCRSNAPSLIDKTEVTRVTGTSAGWASSAMDACYGNVTLALYKLSKVALKPISKFHQSRKLMIELRTLKDINHNNLCRFVGILVDEANLAIVCEFCPKGSLREFFHNESMVIDCTFKFSIINDIVAGLLYIHSSPLAFHGRLKSSNCLVSGRFVVKLSDYGPHSLYEQLDDDECQHDNQNWLRNRVWLAPEHMKSSSRVGSMRGDVYSFGLLLYEIITNRLPFFDRKQNDYVLPLKSLYQELKSTGPADLMASSVAAIEDVNQQLKNDDTSNTNLSPLVDLMQACWRFEPAKRPSSAAVNASLKKITRGVTSKKLLENLTERMEQYTNNLESLVEAKLACLLEEKQRSEELLYQFVPKSIAYLLKEGQFVEPEAFECVTVFYSDIVGFTSLSSESSPMEVVDFLSDLYLCFDSTLEQHDIFKVDTIGDAYIVASGLPQRNDGKHVIEIACAALELRDRLEQFKIPHKPGRSLEMRVGIHSGPCIAGIVGGLDMPKYCVFGDTLTTGKFMESSGLPMKIHITEESRALLANLPDFVIEPRQPKITRDGLPFQTYWLERGNM